MEPTTPPPPPPGASETSSSSGAAAPPSGPPPPADTNASVNAGGPPPPPGPPPPSGPPPTTTSTTPATVAPAAAVTAVKTASSPVLAASASPGGSSAQFTPSSKLLNHQPLDAPDEMDRKWYAHYYHMHKTIQQKDDAAALAILKQQPGADGAAPAPLPFQPEIALLYGIITEQTLAKQYLRFLTSVAAGDNMKNCIGWLQKLIDLKFVKLAVSCRSQLLWLVRELVHMNVAGIDKVIICLMRYLNGGDPSRTTLWLASSIIRILIEHEAWLLSSSTLIPFVFHTFARIAVDHTAPANAGLLKQEIELCTTLWTRRQGDLAPLGRELVRVLNDAKDIPGMNTLWKQLRNVRDDADQDSATLSVARLMSVPTPPKYLAYRLSPKMEEYLVFMMERVQVGSVTRYQKWFSSQFLSSPGSDALVPDLIRYICAVYHPSNQILSSKVTPRYHLLGWLYLLCKNPSVLARVQLAMFFDFLYFKPNDNIMTVEPAMLLMVKSLKSHPSMTLAMIQFLVFAVEKFAASATNKQLMQKGVSTAFSMMLKVGVIPSILSLQSFPLLQSSAPELKSELYRIFPEHFPSPDKIQTPSPHRSPAGGSSPIDSTGSSFSSSPLSYSGESPIRNSPVGAGSPVASPVRAQSPSHSDSGASGVPSDSNTLSSSSFLPDNQQTSESSVEISPSEDIASLPIIGSTAPSEVPTNLLVLGGEDFKTFQELMVEPCSRPTEGFLESLNDILISWIRQDNAIELAAPLGSFLHASLEKIIVSSKISLSESANPTCAGVFDSLLDQVLTEPQELYVPFLQAIHARDITIGFRLLAFCCSRSELKSVDVALAPYIAFVAGIGEDFAQKLVKDITLSQQIDDARAQACALLGKSSKAGATKDEVDAVEAAALYILPYLFRHMEHSSLSKLLARSEVLVQLFLGLATPSMLNAICNRLVLQEFAIFRNRLASILISSLAWSSWEQYSMWDLVVSEIQASNSPSAVKDLMAAARKVLVCVNPEDHVETMNGLLKCLVHFSPDASVLQSVFKLSDAFGMFPVAVLSSWIDKFPDVVKNYVLVILQTAGEGNKEAVAIVHKLERLQAHRMKSIANGPASTNANAHEIGLLKDEAMTEALRKIVSLDSSSAQEYPMLSLVLLDGSSEPPSKKQRLVDEN